MQLRAQAVAVSFLAHLVMPQLPQPMAVSWELPQAMAVSFLAYLVTSARPLQPLIQLSQVLAMFHEEVEHTSEILKIGNS